MGSDAIANGAAHAFVPRDAVSAAKKKRTNRSAKLKQCKLDARREQWLSQVKGKDDCKGAGSISSPTSPSPAHPPRPQNGKMIARRRGHEDEPVEESLQGVVESDSQAQSEPTATGNRRRNVARKSSPTNSISSGSSVGSCSRSVSDPDEEEEDYEGGEGGGGEKEEENGVLDDWEAVADALKEDDIEKNQSHEPASSTVHSVLSPGIPGDAVGFEGTAKPQPIRSTPRAWTPDDADRPHSLPSISKQWSFPSNLERQYNPVPQKCILSLPSACPICCEDLDPTDSSFLPCSCGFRLCLFCHKRILEADCRCPGCRKQYDTSLGSKASEVNTGNVPALPFRLSRSCSMNARF